MVTIKYKEEEFKLKSDFSELTLTEFELICVILSQTTINDASKIIQIIKALGIPDYVIDEMDINDYNAIVAELNYDSTQTTLLNKFTYDGVEYTNNEDKFKLTVRNNMEIEEVIYKDNVHYMAEVMAILYSNDSVTYAQRVTIFKQMPATYVVPIIFYLAKLKNVQ
jgi:hypothetical protein